MKEEYDLLIDDRDDLRARRELLELKIKAIDSELNMLAIKMINIRQNIGAKALMGEKACKQ